MSSRNLGSLGLTLLTLSALIALSIGCDNPTGSDDDQPTPTPTTSGAPTGTPTSSPEPTAEPTWTPGPTSTPTLTSTVTATPTPRTFVGVSYVGTSQRLGEFQMTISHDGTIQGTVDGRRFCSSSMQDCQITFHTTLERHTSFHYHHEWSYGGGSYTNWGEDEVEGSVGLVSADGTWFTSSNYVDHWGAVFCSGEGTWTAQLVESTRR